MEQHDPLYPESQVALPPPSPVTEPARAPNAPEQELTTASAPSIGSPPPTWPIIEDTSERSVVVQAWDAATKGKKFQKPMTTQKKKSKGTIYKSKRDELNEFIEAPSSYEWGKPIISKAALAEKSMSMKTFHARYLQACSLGLTHILASVPKECFQDEEGSVVYIHFSVLWEFFHLEKLNNEIIQMWCL